MRYQEMKIRDALRMGLIAVGSAAALGLCLHFRAAVEPAINRLPLGRGSDHFGSLVFLCGFFAVGSAIMAAWYLITSPRQDAAFIDFAVKHGRKLPTASILRCWMRPTRITQRRPGGTCCSVGGRRGKLPSSA